MKDYNFTALWNRDPDAFEEDERTTFLKMFDKLFFNDTFKQSGRAKRSTNLTEVEETVREDDPFGPQEIEETVGEEEVEYWGENEDFPLFFTREYAAQNYPYLVEDIEEEEVYFFFEEEVLKELGVEPFDLAINPREVYFLSQTEPYAQYLPEPMLREKCELTPHISTAQKVAESIASYIPPLALGLLLRDIFAPIRQEEVCETVVLNMEDIVNPMMNFLIEDWLDNEGDSDFVDYLYSMGIHQHPSSAHPVQERKKREARRFFSTARGTTIIRPKYIRRIMSTPKPLVPKNKKGKNTTPAPPSRKRRRATFLPSRYGSYSCIRRTCNRFRFGASYQLRNELCKPYKPTVQTLPNTTTLPDTLRQKRSSDRQTSLIRFGLERLRFCERLRPSGKPKRIIRKCQAFLAALDSFIAKTAKEDTTSTRSKRGLSPTRPKPRPSINTGTRSGLDWRIRTGSRNNSPDRTHRNPFVMRNKNKARKRPADDRVVFRRRSSSVSSNTRGQGSSLRRVRSQGGAETFADVTVNRWRSMPALTNPVNSQRLPKPAWYKVPRNKWKQFAGKYPTVAAGISMTTSTAYQAMLFYGIQESVNAIGNRDEIALSKALATIETLDDQLLKVNDALASERQRNEDLTHIVQGDEMKSTFDKYFDLFSNHDHTTGPLFDDNKNVLSSLLRKHPGLFEDSPEDTIKALQKSDQPLTGDEKFVLSRLPILLRLGRLSAGQYDEDPSKLEPMELEGLEYPPGYVPPSSQ